MTGDNAAFASFGESRSSALNLAAHRLVYLFDQYRATIRTKRGIDVIASIDKGITPSIRNVRCGSLNVGIRMQGADIVNVKLFGGTPSNLSV